MQTEIAQVTAAVADYQGPVYVRLLRGSVPVVLDPETYRFDIGRAQVLRAGRDVGIIATGFMTERALKAGDTLAAHGVDVAILHVPTIKPFDAEAVARFAASVDRVVTGENHVVSGGLASMVAEALFEHGVVRKLQ